jgi:hypothetical protein
MAIDYSKFDKQVNIEGLQKDIKTASENSGNYKEVPHGTYEVELNKMELGESKKNDPMVTIWFKILEGEYKGSLLFFNQVITQGFQIHIANELLRSMDSGIDIKFETYSQYAQLLLDIHEKVDGNLEFELEYGENKGYNTFKINQVFEGE